MCNHTLYSAYSGQKQSIFSRSFAPPPLNKSCHYYCLLQKTAIYLHARLTFKSTNTLVFFLLAPKCTRGSRTKLLHTIYTLNEIPPVKTTLSIKPFKKRWFKAGSCCSGAIVKRARGLVARACSRLSNHLPITTTCNCRWSMFFFSLHGPNLSLQRGSKE